MISSSVKVVEGSERVKVKRTDSPFLTEEASGVIVILGALVSMVMETGVFKARLGFPKGSVYFPDAMETVPGPS